METQPPRRAADPTADELLAGVTDPVERLILSGRADTVYEAEELYLDSAFDEVSELLSGPMSDDQLGRHPLLVLYRAHGSPTREDGLL